MVGEISLRLFALVGVIMLVLSSTSIGYLMQVKKKSRSSWMLLWFFMCLMLSSIAIILTNSGFAWEWAFAPSQDALLILGGFFLVRFAYLFPVDNQPAEARLVSALFAILALGAMSYAILFAVQYLSNISADIRENRAFYALTPLVILLAVYIFFRRSLHFSSLPLVSQRKDDRRMISSFKALLHPNNISAYALRNYGLALALGLLPAILTLLKPALPGFITNYFFNFGVVIAFGGIMLVYLTYTPEPTTIYARAIGIFLITILLLLGLAGVWFIYSTPGSDSHEIIIKFVYLVLISSGIVIFVLPRFLRYFLLDPIERLINGVKIANQGNLEVEVDVLFEDEVGYLTHSFNQLVKSLHGATQTLKNQSQTLEKEVANRTSELVRINEHLFREIEERKTIEAQLNLQLHYQNTLAHSSKLLLMAAETEDSQKAVLDKVLEQLLSDAQVSRAYILRNITDPEQGLCWELMAEVCAPGIFPQKNLPINQKVPTSVFPQEIVNSLTEGRTCGGPTTEILVNTPQLRDLFLNNNKIHILSFTLFPILINGEWWGVVGFDDCLKARVWDEGEISLLRTSSEMIGNTLQRWKIESQLRETLEELEDRVQKRTDDLSKSNITLSEEIAQRELAQKDLETRLQVEKILAGISTKLLEPARIRENITSSLQDLGHIMKAGRIFLAEFDLNTPYHLRNYIEWHKSEVAPIPEDSAQNFIDALSEVLAGIGKGETAYIQDTTQLFPCGDANGQYLQACADQSLVLSPLIIDQKVQGLLGCSDIQTSPDTVQMNIRAVELVSGMLKSLLQREYLIQNLEERIVERTYQLTTFLDMAILSDQAQNLTDIIQPTLLSISQIGDCDAACVHSIDENRSSLTLIAQLGISSEFLKPLAQISLTDEFSAWLDKSDSFTALGNEEKASVFPAPFYIPGFRAFFSSPLKTGKKSLGLLSCYRVEERPFSPFQATLLNALSDLLGIIVENYRLRVDATNLATVQERQRLAREIHDAVSQSVYSLSLFARSARNSWDEKDADHLIANLSDIEVTAIQAMREMRLLLYQLREVSQEEDIGTTLESRFKQVENRLGILATSDINLEHFLPAHIQHEVWRIIIESLNNSVKHARASHVHVTINCQDHNLYATIQDNGIGFDTQGITPGMGLRNIKSRAVELGGHLDIFSEIGQGTQINLIVPLTCLDGEEGG